MEDDPDAFPAVKRLVLHLCSRLWVPSSSSSLQTKFGLFSNSWYLDLASSKLLQTTFERGDFRKPQAAFPAYQATVSSEILWISVSILVSSNCKSREKSSCTIGTLSAIAHRPRPASTWSPQTSRRLELIKVRSF